MRDQRCSGQSPGPIPVTDILRRRRLLPGRQRGLDGQPPRGHPLTIAPTSGTYDASTPITATLIDTYTNQPVADEPITLSVNGTQSVERDHQRQRRGDLLHRSK